MSVIFHGGIQFTRLEINDPINQLFKKTHKLNKKTSKTIDFLQNTVLRTFPQHSISDKLTGKKGIQPEHSRPIFQRLGALLWLFNQKLLFF